MAQIHIQPSGREIACQEGETVLEAAQRAGLVLPYSCRSGKCGICRGRLVSGEIAPGAEAKDVVADEARGAGDILLCQARPRSDLVVEVRELEAVAGIEVLTMPCRITRIQNYSDDVTGLTLALPEGRGAFRFLAGQFVDLLLWEGGRRSYSIASPPHRGGEIELHIQRRRGGAFSETELADLEEQGIYRFTGPLGTFFLRDDPRPAILIADGTGIAPLAAMVEAALEGGTSRPLHVYWGGETPEDLYCLERVRAWAHDPAVTVTPVVASPQADWLGRTGSLLEAVQANHPDLSGVQVYAAGSPALIAALRDMCPRLGLPTDALFYESFEPAQGPGSNADC